MNRFKRWYHVTLERKETATRIVYASTDEDAAELALDSVRDDGACDPWHVIDSETLEQADEARQHYV